jgi:hypothetical protein
MSTVVVQKAKKTKKHRKHGRNKLSCQRYVSEKRREKNKVRRLKKHIKRYDTNGNDKCAQECLRHCKVVAGLK